MRQWLNCLLVKYSGSGAPPAGSSLPGLCGIGQASFVLWVLFLGSASGQLFVLDS